MVEREEEVGGDGERGGVKRGEEGVKGGAGKGGVSREMPGNSPARKIIDITLIQSDKIVI